MSESAPVPIIVGHAGLVGRRQIVRPPDFEEDADGNKLRAVMVVGAMPGNCRRVLSSPLPSECGGGCSPDCAGCQRDGGCLLDVVRAAKAAGVNDWQFAVDPVSLFWEYVGPPIPGYERDSEGAGFQRAGMAVEAAAPLAPPPSFVCPHCEMVVEQNIANFHYWCPFCGHNANEEA